MTDNRISSLLSKSARSALFSWKQTTEGVDDLINDLWVWYLERPGTQQKLEEADDYLARRLIYKAALQILAKQSLDSDEFQGRNLYSSDSVRAALRGESNNRYLLDILPLALRALDRQNRGQAEAIRSRYIDRVVPEADTAEAAKLKRAVRSVTQQVNIIAITASMDSEGKISEGPGSRSAVFPETRRPKNAGHRDPTGDTAVLLIEHEELRDEYLHESPLSHFLAGQG